MLEYLQGPPEGEWTAVVDIARGSSSTLSRARMESVRRAVKRLGVEGLVQVDTHSVERPAATNYTRRGWVRHDVDPEQLLRSAGIAVPAGLDRLALHGLVEVRRHDEAAVLLHVRRIPGPAYWDREWARAAQLLAERDGVPDG